MNNDNPKFQLFRDLLELTLVYAYTSNGYVDVLDRYSKLVTYVFEEWTDTKVNSK